MNGAPSTVRAVVDGFAAGLTAAGVENARRDARLLLAQAMGLAPERLLLDPLQPVPADTAAAARAMIDRRAAREPVSHILGRRDFWGLTFKVTADTLAPRPDSETVVEAVLDHASEPARLLDLGTGTGCLLLALLSEYRGATGLGIDRSEAALTVARSNADRLGLADRAEFRSGDWCAGLDARFDVILSNPPYIREDERADLDPEVARHEPPEALFAGADGLDAYRALIPGAARHLAPGGLLALEVGRGQHAAVTALCRAQGLHLVAVRSDLAGIPRCVVTTS